MTTIAALAVMMAGVVLWRFVANRPIRWFVAILTIYAVGSFLYAALTGASIRQALAGHGLLQALPYMFQGVFIGAFVLLPIAWIVSVIQLGIPRLRKGSAIPIWFQLVTLTTCIALLVVSLETTGSGGEPGTKRLNTEARLSLLDKDLGA